MLYSIFALTLFLRSQFELSICSWYRNARPAAKVGIVHRSPAKPSKKQADVATTSSKGLGEGDDGLEEIELTNGILIEKLDEVQIKLQQLKHTLEAIASTSSEPSTQGSESQNAANGVFDKGLVIPTANGKRIVYIPIAEVVEKNL